MTAKIYVGTYAKYNDGSIAGEWLDLADYANNEEFFAACRNLHKDEDDPELMFQDWEGIPEQYIGESGLSSDYWEFIDFIENSYLDEVAILAGLDLGIDLDNIEEAYSGTYCSDEEFAQDMAEQCGNLLENPVWPYTCIDWEYAARELMYDYNESNNHYFSNNW